MNHSSLPPPFKAATDVLRPILAVASALAGLTAVLVAIGWKALSSYYYELGGQWILRTEPLSAIIYEGSTYVIPAAAFLFLGFLSFARGSASSTRLRRLAIAALFVGAFLGIGPSLMPNPPSPSNILALTYLGVTLICGSAGLTVVEIIARFQEPGSEWHPYFIWILYLAVLYAFSWAPSLVGTAKANADLDLSSSRLPSVDIDEPQRSRPLRLVTVNGDQAVLIDLSSDVENRNFKVISLKDLKWIHTGRKMR